MSDIIYLYVWYKDPASGKEVAASFMPNAAHPIYDDKGMLKGIYDAAGNILDDYSLGADGIIEDEKGQDVVKVEDQKVDEVYDKAFSIVETASETINTVLNTILYVFFIILGLVVIAAIIWFITFVVGRIKRMIK